MKGLILKVNLIKMDKNELKVEVEGEGHTLLNILQKFLLKNEKVEIAGYTVPHPLDRKAILYVKTKGRIEPSRAILEASEELKEETGEFLKIFKTSLKESRKKT
ncbi:MAG: DNA-directed RNA polymerase subunit L [Candidatus Bathyarchaeota archaeon]